jgi:hypothetical protein
LQHLFVFLFQPFDTIVSLLQVVNITLFFCMQPLRVLVPIGVPSSF